MESVAFSSDMTLRVLVFGGAYFVGINLLAVLLFWMDKRRARRGIGVSPNANCWA